MSDELYMHRCLQLALMGAGSVAPNPMVGAVLVYHNRIIGEGFHQQYGQAHAEVNCINSVQVTDISLIADSTLYVSLEPCVHFGKTPPCADLIISKQIKKVVIGCRDPFDAVNGKGIEKLRDAGIEVVYGILEADCISMNKRFFTFHQKKRPYIILKWAQSANGAIAAAGKEAMKISNDFSNRLVHRWRSEEAAIAVGTATALLDDPALTTRLWPGKDPIRILLDKHLVIEKESRIFSTSASCLVFNFIEEKTVGNIHYIQLSPTEPLLKQLLTKLYEHQIQSVIIEGGSKFIQSFLEEDYWDEVRIIINDDLLIENGYAAPVLNKAELKENFRLGSDRILFYHPLA